MARIRVGDTVAVISGRDKGRRGVVLRVLPAKGMCVVEGVNRVWKHVRPSRRNPQGGRIQKSAPIPMCKVMPVDPGAGNRPVRVRMVLVDGVKHRKSARGGTDLGTVGNPRKVRKAPAQQQGSGDRQP